MNVNVVRMFISADRVEGQNDIRLELADIFDNASGHFIDRMVDLRVGMFVVLRAGHARIAIAQKKNFLQAQIFRGAHQFIGAKFGRILETVEMFLIHSPRFAAGRADIIRVISLLRIQRKRAAQTK